jgi:hypothetical protein
VACGVPKDPTVRDFKPTNRPRVGFDRRSVQQGILAA